MTVRIKGVTVELNGADYVIPPIALGALEQLQERIAHLTAMRRMPDKSLPLSIAPTPP